MENELQQIIDPKTIIGKEGMGIDLSKYDKMQFPIEKAEIIQVKSEYTPLIEGSTEHLKQWALKISTVVIVTIGEDEEKIEFRASELFNLSQNDKGEITGWPKGDKSNLMKFLKDLGLKDKTSVDSLQDVIDFVKGKTAVVKAQEKEKNEETKTFLKFRY